MKIDNSKICSCEAGKVRKVVQVIKTLGALMREGLWFEQCICMVWHLCVTERIHKYESFKCESYSKCCLQIYLLCVISLIWIHQFT